MKPFVRKRSGPEAKIQEDFMNLLKVKDWFCKETHGNEFQFGFPDIYAAHARYGARWIEVKNPAGYVFTPAQMETFPSMAAKGVGIWIVTAATEEQYELLFKPPNWWHFLSILGIK